MRRVDWSALLRLGLHGLRLTPETFWVLTPAELTTMAGAEAGPRRLDRAGLRALAALHPDNNQNGEDGRDE